MLNAPIPYLNSVKITLHDKNSVTVSPSNKTTSKSGYTGNNCNTGQSNELLICTLFLDYNIRHVCEVLIYILRQEITMGKS